MQISFHKNDEGDWLDIKQSDGKEASFLLSDKGQPTEPSIIWEVLNNAKGLTFEAVPITNEMQCPVCSTAMSHVKMSHTEPKLFTCPNCNRDFQLVEQK